LLQLVDKLACQSSCQSFKGFQWDSFPPPYPPPARIARHCSASEVAVQVDGVYVNFSGRDSIELGTNDTMSSEKSDELQSTCCIEKIEKQVATLAMEKALNFILEYHEGKQRLYNTPVSGKGLNQG
jgi:hypothetical protein